MNPRANQGPFSEDLRYSEEHIWFRRGEASTTVGVTERISRILTLVATVEMPPPGTSLTSGDELATIEDQKAVIEIPAPAPLEVVALNNKVIADPMLVRMDPYGRGWLMRVRLYEDGWEELLDATAYQEVIERQTR